MFIMTNSGNLEIHKDGHGPVSTASSSWEKTAVLVTRPIHIVVKSAY